MNKVIRDVHLSRHALRYKQRKTGLENHEPMKLQSFYFRPITTKEHVHNFSIQSDSYRLSVVTDFHYIFFVS